MAATTYYVNTSHCEGLCLPLMEFLCCGIPAVAPDHTAMGDYINTRVAFPVASSIEQNVWPEDTRDLFRTLRYRINWESLRDGFLESYRVATEEPKQYRRMSKAARQELGKYCSVTAVTRKLSKFFKTPALPSSQLETEQS
jgi:glycosyltransferase involved in cell wall biosynthesis